MGTVNALAFASAASVALLSSGISAQETLPEPTADSVLEEVVVTAQGREQPLQNVPVAVSVISGDTLQRSSVANLESLSVRLPNFRIATAPVSDFVTVRGVGSSLNLGFEQSVGTFVDGIYRGRARSTRSGLFDIERVELLKGPQSTFFGNNTIAGAINITTRKPASRFEADVLGSYWPEFGEYSVEGGTSLPLSDALAVRIAARQSGLDGYASNSNLNDDGPHLNGKVGRFSLAWKPSGAVQIDAALELGRNRDRGNANYELLECPAPAAFGAPAGACGRYLAANGNSVENQLDYHSAANPSYFDYDYTQGTVTTTIGLRSSALVLTSGYFDHDYDLLYDPLPIPATRGGSVVGTNQAIANVIGEGYTQYSQEIRLVSPDDQRISYIVGLYYQRAELTIDNFVGVFFAPIGSFSGGAVPATTPVAWYVRATEDTDAHSAFVSATAHLREDLHLNIGLRYTSVSKDDDRSPAVGTVAGSVPSTSTFTQLSPGVEALLAPRVGVDLGNFADPSRKDTEFLPSVSLQYDLTPNAMVYASYARGFKAGGYSIGAANASFDPETVDAFEVGLKSTWLDRRLTLNIDVFESRYKDLQESATIIPQGATATRQIVGNVADTTTRGLELGFSLNVTQSFSLFSDVAYLSSEYENFANGPCTSLQAATIANCQQDLSGKVRPFSPRYSGNIGAALDLPVTEALNMRLESTVYAATRFRQQPTSDPRLEQPGYAKLDARFAVGRNDGRWEGAVVGRNLTDKKTASYRQIFPSSPGSIAALADPPRSVGVQFSARF
jgi:iron complex outermembrane recepter protein